MGRRDASLVDDNRAILHDPSDALDDGVDVLQRIPFHGDEVCEHPALMLPSDSA